MHAEERYVCWAIALTVIICIIHMSLICFLLHQHWRRCWQVIKHRRGRNAQYTEAQPHLDLESYEPWAISDEVEIGVQGPQ